VLVTSLCFLWALGVNRNDILIPHLRDISADRICVIANSSVVFGGYFVAALLPDADGRRGRWHA